MSDGTDCALYVDEPVKASDKTLLDWFAGQALQGIAARLHDQDVIYLADGIRAGAIEARASFSLAEAAIAERKRRAGNG